MVNGGIPQLGDLSAHLSRTVMQVTSMLRPDFRGLAVIDWEEWRPLWGGNFGTKIEYRRLSKLLVREERPDLSEGEVKSLARERFEESARRFMEETLRTVVTHRPNGLWGFYGFPACMNKKMGKKGRTKTELSTALLMVMTFSETDVCRILLSVCDQVKTTLDAAAGGPESEMTGCAGSGVSPPLSIPASTCHEGWRDPRTQR